MAKVVQDWGCSRSTILWHVIRVAIRALTLLQALGILLQRTCKLLPAQPVGIRVLADTQLLAVYLQGTHQQLFTLVWSQNSDCQCFSRTTDSRKDSTSWRE